MPPVLARLTTAALVAAAAFVGLRADPARAADPTGTWLTEDGRARVRTERCGPDRTQLCGYVVWRNPQDTKSHGPVDKANPDPRKQSRPVLGHQLILGLKPNADNRHAGKIYNADNGKSYDVTIWSESASELSVRGCLLAMLCSTQTWTRVSDVVPDQLKGPTNGEGGPRSDPEWLPAAGAGAQAKPRPGPAPAQPPAPR